MPSELMVTLYFGLVPVVLVVGIVQAVRKRERLGLRATRQLVGGAGLVLVMYATVPLRALLPLPNFFAMYEAMALLQMLGQAVGLGLIIAAAFTGRPAASAFARGLDRHADDDEPTGKAVGAWVAVVAVIALAAGGAWFIRSMQERTYAAPPWQMDEDRAAERCVTEHTASPQAKGKPIQAMLLRKDSGWLRVYVSEPDNWIIACQGGPDALMGAFATAMRDDSVVEGRFFGGYESVVKGHLLLGRVPEGTAFIEAVLPGGRTLQGEHNGAIFVVWAPGVSVEGARVTFMTKDRDVITTDAAPAA